MIFETDNLLVRRSTLDDVSDYLSFWNDPVAMRYIGDGTWGGGEDIVIKVLEENIAFYDRYAGLGFWSVVDKATQKVIGEAGLGILHSTGEIEAGFLLAQPNWRRGYGTQVLVGLLEYGFKKLELRAIAAVAHPENAASIRVLTKCGFVPCGAILDRGITVAKFRASPDALA
jgi:RimJ/RimL family protein N-acetyltransferase